MTTLKEAKTIIWDFDGTLGYRVGGWTAALEDVLRRDAPECSATADDLRPHIQTGFPWHNPHQAYPIRSAEQWWSDLAPVFERAYAAVGITENQTRCLASAVRTAYTNPAAWRLYDDVPPTLDLLSTRGWTHVMLSNHVPELLSILRYLRIDERFARVFNSAETGYEKPHTEAFRDVLATVSGTESVWMIGDNMIADIAGAAAAGIPGILVRKRHENAPYQCDHLSQVPAILKKEIAPTVQSIPTGDQTDWRQRL